ncbi:MAG TPA: VCBS repeat-containing protein [Pseudonocardiaceae bacterium]|nr:VCBS repeat-containing protein [Pseudonocardiaceae bacterium]
MTGSKGKSRRGLAVLPVAGALLIGVVAPGMAAAATPGSNTQTVVDGARAYVVTNGVRSADASTVACDPSAPNGTANDQAIANQLNGELTGELAGAMTAYRVSCAREIANAVAAYGLDEHATQIALTAAIAESTMEDLTSGSGSSVGLYQQQSPWGTVAQREDPAQATDAFLGAMQQLYPNDSWENAVVGDVDQAVQRSAYPGRYEPQAGDGGLIAEALTGIPFTQAPGDFDNGGLDDVSGDHYGDLLYADTGHNVDYVPNNINGNPDHQPYYGGVNGAGVAFGLPSGALTAAGDVSGDGYADLLIYNPGNDSVAYYPNNINAGHGPYATGYTVANGLAHVAGSPVVKIFAADLTGDGHAELAYLTAAGTLWAIPNNIDSNPGHTPFYTGALEIANGLANAQVTIGDVTGDHFADLVYYVNGSLYLIPNNILSDPNLLPFDTAGVPIATPSGISNPSNLTATDITGDGYADLLWSNANGDVGYLANNTLSNPDHGYFETPSENVAEIGAGNTLI